MEFYLKHNSFCSEFFGMKCGDVEPNYQSKKTTEVELCNLVKMSCDDGFQFLSLRFDPSNLDLLAAAVLCDFVFIECLLTFSLDLNNSRPLPYKQFSDHIALNGDIEAISQISRGSFKLDRFHLDPMIDNCDADELKAVWSANCVRGRSDKVFVVRSTDGGVIGFNACKISADAAFIDLIAVEGKYHKSGVASQLLQMCVQEYRGKKCRLLVGTQANNKASVNLYLKHGLSLSRVQYTFHRHARI